MRFYSEFTQANGIIIESIDQVSNVLEAKADVLRLLTELIRVGFDGLGRTASVRIISEDRRFVANMSLTLEVQE